MCSKKNKIAILGPGRYCLPIGDINGSEPLEWSNYIEYCHSANFFMVCATVVRYDQNANILHCVRLKTMSWATNLISKVTKPFTLGLVMADIQFYRFMLCGP